MHWSVERIVEVYGKHIDREDIDSANRYLLAVIEAMIREWQVGALDASTLQKMAQELRDKLVEGPGFVNPFVMEVLGILEEKVDEENVREALDLIRRLWQEETLAKLEV